MYVGMSMCMCLLSYLKHKYNTTNTKLNTNHIKML